jgi:hypothetical protein
MNGALSLTPMLSSAAKKKGTIIGTPIPRSRLSPDTPLSGGWGR